MRKLVVFNTVSVDGYIADATGDMSWAHAGTDDAEWRAFTNENASGEGMLVFGRVTYQMMASFWPTPAAAHAMPVVAERMNTAEKIVFSRMLKSAPWQNTTLVAGDPAAEVRRLKSGPGEGLVILGSASIVAQLAQEGLIDEYQLVIAPVVLGSGKSMFAGVTRHVALKRTTTRTFKNGRVLVCYERAG